MKRVTGHGLAMHGDGFARALLRINAAGFENVTAYVEADPKSPLIKLADELNESDADVDPLPISADHLAVMWRDEALDGDEATSERFARRAMVGEIHRHLSEGWPSEHTDEATFPLSRALVSWTAIIGHDLQARATDVWFALEDSEPPPGWLPTDADDPRIIAAFGAKWRGE